MEFAFIILPKTRGKHFHYFEARSVNPPKAGIIIWDSKADQDAMNAGPSLN